VETKSGLTRVGETYTFIQEDRSNYYHPLGFAYFSDGNLEAEGTELEPGISQGTSGCQDTLTCPSPVYSFPGNENASLTTLDEFEAKFGGQLPEWTSSGPYHIEVRFDDETYTDDLFYFCHIHKFMSVRIKLLKNGLPISNVDKPATHYQEKEPPSDFDRQCGSYGLGDFALPNALCPDRFVCGVEDASEELQQFSACIDAANCFMMAGMTTGVQATEGTALFLHQMIPHHGNAVNTAKTLLKSKSLLCPDLTDEENPDCILESLLRDIINSQNHQIDIMRDYLTANNFPQEDNCDVFVETLDELPVELRFPDGETSSAMGVSLIVSLAVALLSAWELLL
jgi:hypothetical protein